MRIVRLIFIGLFSFVLIAFVSGVYLIQRPEVWEFALSKALLSQKGLILKDIKIGHCAVNFNSIYLSNIRLHIEFNEHDYDLTNVNLQLFIKDKNGNIDGGVAVIDTYRFENFKGFFELKDKVFYLKNLHSVFAGGFLNAQMQYHVTNKTYAVDINLREIDTNILKKSSAVFGQVKANVKGVLSLQGDLKGLKDVKGNLSAQQGGSMKAKILEYLVDYMPQKTAVKNLISKNADILLNDAQVTFSSLSLEQVRLHVKILSLSMGLDLNVDIDLNCDGGLEAGLQAMQKFLKGS